MQDKVTSQVMLPSPSPNSSQENSTSRHFVLLTGTAEDRRKTRAARVSANGGNTENGRHKGVLGEERGIWGSSDAQGYTRVRDAGELARVREPTTGRYVRRAGQSSGPLEASPKFFTLHLDGSGCLREGEPPVSAEATSSNQGYGSDTSRDKRTQRKVADSQRGTMASTKAENIVASSSKAYIPNPDRSSATMPAIVTRDSDPIDSQTRSYSMQQIPQKRSEKHRIEFLLSEDVEPIRASSRSPGIEFREFTSSPSPMSQHQQTSYTYDHPLVRGDYAESSGWDRHNDNTSRILNVMYAEFSTAPTSPSSSLASASFTEGPYTSSSSAIYSGALVDGMDAESQTYRPLHHRGISVGHHRSKSLSVTPARPDLVHRPSSTSGHYAHTSPRSRQTD